MCQLGNLRAESRLSSACNAWRGDCIKVVVPNVSAKSLAQMASNYIMFPTADKSPNWQSPATDRPHSPNLTSPSPPPTLRPSRCKSISRGGGRAAECTSLLRMRGTKVPPGFESPSPPKESVHTGRLFFYAQTLPTKDSNPPGDEGREVSRRLRTRQWQVRPNEARGADPHSEARRQAEDGRKRPDPPCTT